MMMKLHGLVKWEDSASWYTEVGKHMVTLHGEEVKVGDKVWDIHRGWGEVTEIHYKKFHNYPICVSWEDYHVWITKDGKVEVDEEMPSLFWQPIVFEIPKKPYREKTW